MFKAESYECELNKCNSCSQTVNSLVGNCPVNKLMIQFSQIGIKLQVNIKDAFYCII